MNKSLPGMSYRKGFSAKRKTSGFTLIELLIVIAIIAILAVMGFAAFRGFTSRGNDSRRAADIKAIGDALEANKSTSTGYYTALTNSQFASGSIPIDPTGGATGTSTHPGYCLTYTTNAVNTITFPTGTYNTVWTAATGACNSANGITGGTAANDIGWTSVSSSTPGGNVTAWSLCSVKDDLTSVICRNSAQ